MKGKIKNRKIVIVNQAANYLTIGFCNAFFSRFEEVSLITGSIHEQGEMLCPEIQVQYINKFLERPPGKKILSYAVACFRIFWLLKTKYRKYEVLFVSLPPMAYLLNLLLSNRFSMILWDIYPDVLKISGINEKNIIYRYWSELNRKSFKKAYRLFTIGNRIADSLMKYIESEKILILPIWSIFQQNLRIPKSDNPFVEAHKLAGKFIVQYSGNIGVTHKVELVIELAELLNHEKDIVFQIIGRGPRASALRKLVEDKKLSNCIFLPFQSDEMFHYSLSAADLGIVILNEKVSKGSVPSKAYNLMSLGIPSLYIAASDSELGDYANKFENAGCFAESQLLAAKNFILELSENKESWECMSENALEASKNFRRTNADKYVEKYLKL